MAKTFLFHEKNTPAMNLGEGFKTLPEAQQTQDRPTKLLSSLARVTSIKYQSDSVTSKVFWAIFAISSIQLTHLEVLDGASKDAQNPSFTLLLLLLPLVML